MLWSQAALLGVKSGHRVTAIIPQRHPLEKRVEALAKGGVELRFQPVQPRLPGIPERILRKLFKRPFRRGDWWNSQGLGKADLLCVNQGGAYCALDNDGLCGAILRSGVPYALLGRCDSLFPHFHDGNIKEARVFFLGAGLYVAASRSTLDLARLQLAGEFPKALAIHSPIADYSSCVPSYPDSREGYRMACVGRYRQDFKGQHLLMQCLAEEKWRKRPLQVDFYGDGPDAGRLRELSRFLGLDDRVFWRGRTDDLGGVWARAHIAVQPSIIEGAPQSILESMLCRRAAIATAVGGIPEWIVEGETGYLAEAPTVESLDRALERAWQGRENWESLGLRAREFCCMKKIADPAAELFQNLIEMRNIFPNSIDSTKLCAE